MCCGFSGISGLDGLVFFAIKEGPAKPMRDPENKLPQSSILNVISSKIYPANVMSQTPVYPHIPKPRLLFFVIPVSCDSLSSPGRKEPTQSLSCVSGLPALAGPIPPQALFATHGSKNRFQVG